MRLRRLALLFLLLTGCDPVLTTDDAATGTDTGVADSGTLEGHDAAPPLRPDGSTPGPLDASVPDGGALDGGPPGDHIVLTERRAFPTAEGYGALATGGRGGTILYVTTTEDTGDPGSLRWALQEDYPRIIYFLVGGAFPLRSLLYVDNGDFTIAGETANDLGGVNIQNSVGVDDARIYISGAANMVIRYISVEGGWWQFEELRVRHDQFTLTGVHNIIVDHFTSGWGAYNGAVPGRANEETGLAGLATTQRSLLHEGVRGQNVGGVGGIQSDWVRGRTDDRAEQEALWSAWEGFSNHHNAFIGQTHRFYNTSGNGTAADQVYNNYIYGWQFRMSRHTNGNQPIDIYRNYYEAAPYNFALDYEYMHKFDYNPGYNLDPPVPVEANFFLAENLIIARDGSEFQGLGDDNWPMLTHFLDTARGTAGTTVGDAGRRTSPSPPAQVPVTIGPTAGVKDDVLANAGAGVRFRADGTTYNVNEIDQRYLEWARTRTGAEWDEIGDSSTFVFPDYPSSTRDLATLDDEGVPIGWEPPSDVVNDAGYSRLELYLAELAGDFHVLRAAAGAGSP